LKALARAAAERRKASAPRKCAQLRPKASTGGDADSMLRGIWLDAPFGAPLPLLSRERIYFRCVVVSKPRTRCVARTLAYSSLPGLTRQSMRAGSNAQSNVLHVIMDHRVKPGGDEERQGAGGRSASGILQPAKEIPLHSSPRKFAVDCNRRALRPQGKNKEKERRKRMQEKMTLQTQSATPPAHGVEHFWYASYPPGIPRTIDADTYSSLPSMLVDACTRHAPLPAFECLGATMTYADWERVSRAFATYLAGEAKFHPGDRLAIMLPNLLAYPVAFLGALRAGLIVVNVNPLYTPRELKEQLVDSGATAIVIMENFAHKLEQVVGETKIRHVVVARLGDFMPPVKRSVFNLANTYLRKAVPDWHFADFTFLQHACSRAPDAHYGDVAPGPTAPALLQYTGGTTGVAKANPYASQSGRQCVAVPGGDRAVFAGRAGKRAHPAAALSYLLADREPPCLCADGRAQRARSRSARHQGADPHLRARARRHHDRREHAIQRAGQPH
jgi:hypothetical protein